MLGTRYNMVNLPRAYKSQIQKSLPDQHTASYVPWFRHLYNCELFHLATKAFHAPTLQPQRAWHALQALVSIRLYLLQAQEPGHRHEFLRFQRYATRHHDQLKSFAQTLYWVEYDERTKSYVVRVCLSGLFRQTPERRFVQSRSMFHSTINIELAI